jgi:hypothetical protein
MFLHQVCFWLKKSAPANAKEQLIADCRKYLGGIPTVKQMWAGAPAMTPRDVVDNTYDVGLCVVLEDSAGHDVYQTHDLHNQFIAHNKANWERVQVRDFIG